MRVITQTLEYLRIYFHEWAYMEPQWQAETRRAFERKLCYTSRTMSTAESKSREVRIVQLQPATDCSLVWCLLQNVILPDGAWSAWYNAIHDIIPANVRLY